MLSLAARVGSALIDNVILHEHKPIVAIDDPAGAGKSTVARQVAQALGLLYLDTGDDGVDVGWCCNQELRLRISARSQNQQVTARLNLLATTKLGAVWINNKKLPKPFVVWK